MAPTITGLLLAAAALLAPATPAHAAGFDNPIFTQGADALRGGFENPIFSKSAGPEMPVAPRNAPPAPSHAPVPDRSAPPEVAPSAVQSSAGSTRQVSSTAYCLTGTMASGRRVYWGAVAMNGVPFGSRWEILSGSLRGRVLTVGDRIGHGSGFDVAMPGACGAARQYGRQAITIRRVG